MSSRNSLTYFYLFVFLNRTSVYPSRKHTILKKSVVRLYTFFNVSKKLFHKQNMCQKLFYVDTEMM